MMLLFLLAACTPSPPTWSPAQDVVALTGDAAPTVDGGAPVGAQLGHTPGGELVLAWAQVDGRLDGAPWTVLRRTWDGAAWSPPERHAALQPWCGLDANGDVVLIDSIGPADVPRTRRPADGATWGLPQLYRLADLGLKFPLDLEAPRLHAAANGRLLLARRVGPAIAVLQQEGDSWTAVGGMPAVVALPPDAPDPRGAPALASDGDRIAVAWRVAKEGTTRLGADGRVETAGFGGVAVEVWDGTSWQSLSSPKAPALVEPWPAGASARRAQTRWRTAWGERQAERWPGTLQVRFDGEAVEVDWRASDGGRRSRWADDTWQTTPSELPASPVETPSDATGTSLRLVRDGRPLGTPLTGGGAPLDDAPAIAADRTVVRVDGARTRGATLVVAPDGPSLPAPHAGDLTLGTRADGTHLVAWRDLRRTGGALHVASLAGGAWTRLPGAGPEDSLLPQAGRDDRVLALGGGERPVVVVRRAARVEAWTHDGTGWASTGPAIEAPAKARVVAALDASARPVVLLANDESWQRWRLDGPAWTELPAPDACGPPPGRLVSLAYADGPHAAVGWTARVGPGDLAQATLCIERDAGWTARPAPEAPVGALRSPQRPDEHPTLHLTFAGDELIAMVTGLGPVGTAARVDRWTDQGWTPVLGTPDRGPIAWPRLVADAGGACLGWAEAGPHLALRCADRGR